MERAEIAAQLADTTTKRIDQGHIQPAGPPILILLMRVACLLPFLVMVHVEITLVELRGIEPLTYSMRTRRAEVVGGVSGGHSAVTVPGGRQRLL